MAPPAIRLYRAYYHATPHVIQKVHKRVQRDRVGRFTRRAFVDNDGRVLMVGWFV
jgi:hypothetical protein